MATIREFGEEGRFFATVFNKDREMKSAYFQAGTDKYPELFVDDIETLVQSGLTEDEIEALDEEIADKVFFSKVYVGTGSYRDDPENWDTRKEWAEYQRDRQKGIEV